MIYIERFITYCIDLYFYISRGILIDITYSYCKDKKLEYRVISDSKKYFKYIKVGDYIKYNIFGLTKED
jgi:hypothetical protein